MKKLLKNLFIILLIVLKLSKRDFKIEDDFIIIDNIDARVTNISFEYYNEVTVSGGKIVLEDLLKGFYSIKEKSAKSSYLVNTETYTVEIKPNETTTKTIVNKEPTRNYNCKKRK